MRNLFRKILLKLLPISLYLKLINLSSFTSSSLPPYFPSLTYTFFSLPIFPSRYHRHHIYNNRPCPSRFSHFFLSVPFLAVPLLSVPFLSVSFLSVPSLPSFLPRFHPFRPLIDDAYATHYSRGNWAGVDISGSDRTASTRSSTR